jgi:hypothetical protein
MRKAWTRRPIRLIGLRAARLEPPSPAEQLVLPVAETSSGLSKTT